MVIICACSSCEETKRVPLALTMPAYETDDSGNVSFKGRKKQSAAKCTTFQCKCLAFQHFKPEVSINDKCTNCGCSAESHGWKNWK